MKRMRMISTIPVHGPRIRWIIRRWREANGPPRGGLLALYHKLRSVWISHPMCRCNNARANRRGGFRRFARAAAGQ